MAYSVLYTTYFDNITKCYCNILILNEDSINDNDLLSITKNVKLNNISPFDNYNNCANCNNTYTNCIRAFIDDNQNYITTNNVTTLINKLTTIGYSIDTNNTKLLKKNNFIRNLVFIINKN